MHLLIILSLYAIFITKNLVVAFREPQSIDIFI